MNMPLLTLRRAPGLRFSTFCIGLFFSVFGVMAPAAENAKKTFNLPAALAGETLKQFAAQADREIVFAPEAIGAVPTKAVKGELTPREALDQMLAGTGLVITQDAKTGAFAVRKEVAGPNESRVAPPTAGSDHPGEYPRSEAWGGIRGQVSNAVTGANLGNVRINVRETNRDYYTERDGTFEIAQLGPGAYTLVIDYPGLDSLRVPVVVEASRTARLNLAMSSDVYVLPKLVVAGQREGNAAAIAEQRQASNVENVLTADAFGDITKANLGNILKRIPGVTGITDDEIDTSVIMVRGMEAYLTSIDIDGTRAASAFNGSRRQNVNAVPADIIEKVEVVKATTAEDDADSLGGRVKLTTKSAFDLKERRLDLRLGGSYNMTYGKKVTPDGKNYVPPSALITYSDIVGLFGRPNSLGILVTANFDRFRDARSNTDFPWVNAASKTPKVGEKDYTVFQNTSSELHDQVRKGGSLRFDYRLGDHTVLGLRGTFTRYVDDLVRSRNEFTGGTVDTALSDPDPYYTVVNNTAYDSAKYMRQSTTDTLNIRANGVTTLSAAKLSYDFVFTKANKFEFRNDADFVSNRKFSYAMDRWVDNMYPHLTLLAGLDPFTDRFTDTASTGLEARRQAVDNRIWASHLDCSKDFDWKLPIRLQTGLRYRGENRVEDQDRFTAAVAPAVGKNLSGYLDENWKNGGGGRSLSGRRGPRLRPAAWLQCELRGRTRSPDRVGL